MTTTEHLDAIKAKCHELLAIAEKRTPGEWENDGFNIKSAGRYMGHCSCSGTYAFPSLDNAAFIASAAGPFEASLRSTIAAIDFFQMIQSSYSHNTAAHGMAADALSNILAAWPFELL